MMSNLATTLSNEIASTLSSLKHGSLLQIEDVYDLFWQQYEKENCKLQMKSGYSNTVINILIYLIQWKYCGNQVHSSSTTSYLKL